MELKWFSSSEINDLFYDSPLLMNEYRAKKFEYLDLKYIGNHRVLLALGQKGNKQIVMGVLQLGKYPKDPNLYMMIFVSIHPDYRKMGIAKTLIKEMCNYVSSIPNARIELSTYEKEGEVLINSVRQIAQEFPELSIKHRVWGGKMQDARQDFFRCDDEVMVNDPISGYQGLGKIMYFDEFENDMVMIRKKQVKDPEESVVLVAIKYLSKS